MVDDQARAELTTDLDQLFREGARRMLAVALEAEAYIATHAELATARKERYGLRGRLPLMPREQRRIAGLELAIT